MAPHEFIRANPGALVISGSRYAASGLVRESCDSALLGIQRYTFRGLVYALSTDFINARGLTPLGRIARELIAASVARQVELNYLREAVRFPGFPAALANTLRHLRLHRIPRSHRRDTGRSGEDLAALLEAYESELRPLDFADYPLRVELAIESVRANTPAVVLLLGLNLQTVAERELRETLVNRAPAHLDRRLLRSARVARYGAPSSPAFCPFRRARSRAFPPRERCSAFGLERSARIRQE